MKRVILKRMKLKNFKALRDYDISFNDGLTEIIGDNGTCKTTLMKAYLWALFQKNEFGKDEDVYPLDSNNVVIHNMTTSVEIILEINGVDVSILRAIEEDWQTPRGTTTPVLKGNKTTRFIDGVPMNVSEFSAKLSSFINEDDWFLLSTVEVFNRLPKDVKRRKLNDVAGEISDVSICGNDLPFVFDAIIAKKDIDGYKKELLAKRAKSKQELDEIPVKVEAKEQLRTILDFPALRRRRDELQSKVKEIDFKLQGLVTVEVVDESSKLRNKVSAIQSRISDIESGYRSKATESSEAKSKKVSKIQNDIYTRENSLKMEDDIISNYTKRKADYVEQKTRLGEKWKERNGEVFNDTTSITCPTCGAPYDTGKVEQQREEAKKRFNDAKTADLNALVAKANSINEDIKVVDERLSKSSSNIEVLSNEIAILKEQLVAANSMKVVTFDELISGNEEIKKLSKELEEIKEQLNNPTKVSVDNTEREALNAEKTKVISELQEVNLSIGKEEVNKMIDGEQEMLEASEKILSQAVADCDNALMQIECFKKRKIEMVESKVSSLFKIVRWKFFEPNITNDGVTDICVAIVDGVNFDSLNTAQQINAGIDVIQGLSNALGVSVPLFIDHKESVVSHLPIDSQTITLAVKEGFSLTVLN